jgi:flagellar biosynthesis/type III secretory pathway protein FliH
MIIIRRRRKEGIKKEGKKRKKEGREEGRKERRKEGRKEGKKEGRTEGRKEGRKKEPSCCYTVISPSQHSSNTFLLSFRASVYRAEIQIMPTIWFVTPEYKQVQCKSRWRS